LYWRSGPNRPGISWSPDGEKIITAGFSYISLMPSTKDAKQRDGMIDY
jgi:hypothetical protein